MNPNTWCLAALVKCPLGTVDEVSPALLTTAAVPCLAIVDLIVPASVPSAVAVYRSTSTAPPSGGTLMRSTLAAPSRRRDKLVRALAMD